MGGGFRPQRHRSAAPRHGSFVSSRAPTDWPHTAIAQGVMRLSISRPANVGVGSGGLILGELLERTAVVLFCAKRSNPEALRLPPRGPEHAGRGARSVWGHAGSALRSRGSPAPRAWPRSLVSPTATSPRLQCWWAMRRKAQLADSRSTNPNSATANSGARLPRTLVHSRIAHGRIHIRANAA